MNNEMKLRQEIQVQYPTIDALRILAAKLDPLVGAHNISIRADFSHGLEWAAHTIIAECEKHGLTEAQIRAVL